MSLVTRGLGSNLITQGYGYLFVTTQEELLDFLFLLAPDKRIFTVERDEGSVYRIPQDLRLYKLEGKKEFTVPFDLRMPETEEEAIFTMPGDSRIIRVGAANYVVCPADGRRIKVRTN